MFPGTSAEDVANATKLKILAKKNPKLKKPEEPLAMGIKPMDKSGEVSVDFNQATMAPGGAIDQSIY